MPSVAVRKYRVTFLVYEDGRYSRHEREFRSLRGAADFCVGLTEDRSFDKIFPVEYPELTPEEVQVFKYLTDGKVTLVKKTP